jgi:hypothetical protein
MRKPNKKKRICPECKKPLKKLRFGSRKYHRECAYKINLRRSQKQAKLNATGRRKDKGWWNREGINSVFRYAN